MGTTAAALRSGVPTVITPCAFDQFNNARMVEQHGVGTATRQFSKVTAADLSAAIRKCVTDDDLRQTAAAMGKNSLLEDGATRAVQELDKFFIEQMGTGRYKERAARRTLRNAELRDQAAPGLCWFLGKLCCGARPGDYDAHDFEVIPPSGLP